MGVSTDFPSEIITSRKHPLMTNPPNLNLDLNNTNETTGDEPIILGEGSQ